MFVIEWRSGLLIILKKKRSRCMPSSVNKQRVVGPGQITDILQTSFETSLITLPVERYLYNIAADRSGLETKTAQFWMAILHREFPATRQFYLVQEQNPSDESRRRVDCKVFTWDDTRNTVRDVLYVEFKRAEITPADRELAVKQVEDYCSEYIMAPMGYTSLWCMVCYGTRAAFWEAKSRVRTRSGRTSCSAPQDLAWIDADTPEAKDISDFFKKLSK
ncbi:hypothetical protein T310_9671 [Rasamsonia emersonii CBS 393.64]|uniref:Fungal-type protein kinase domain-containing protein n=1 Tax=Rasamsonia emersonii (strain ATCC 16479 / CBS 393.64 / IMI 116815) TaxID=1408163 RepID=A0A0F4YES8_RASE3|nr:hypothetical protein T310_9671 [Rasamsonia emersonii CBS 393.64]KKA16717.1 hypothetical protein T310_9671 [Rasamsonia emersonii CBS 393.64]